MRVAITYCGQGDSAAIFFVHKADDPRLCVAVKFPHFLPGENQSFTTADQIEFTKGMMIHEGQIMFYLSELAYATPHLLTIYQAASLYQYPIMITEALLNYEDASRLFLLPPSPQWLRLVRQVLFQLFYTLSLLQDRFVGFRHNDLSTKNVMVSYLTELEATEYVVGDTLFSLRPARMDTKIIDFACANAQAEGLRNPCVVRGNFIDFHIVDMGCTFYDVHFFFADMLRIMNVDVFKVELLHDSVRQLVDFILRVVPHDYFSGAFTDRSRLRTEAQALMLSDSRLPKSLCDVLQNDPFFDSFRLGPVEAPVAEDAVMGGVLEEANCLPTELLCSL
jgi:hypothetical protein